MIHLRGIDHMRNEFIPKALKEYRKKIIIRLMTCLSCSGSVPWRLLQKQFMGGKADRQAQVPISF